MILVDNYYRRIQKLSECGETTHGSNIYIYMASFTKHVVLICNKLKLSEEFTTLQTTPAKLQNCTVVLKKL